MPHDVSHAMLCDASRTAPFENQSSFDLDGPCELYSPRVLVHMRDTCMQIVQAKYNENKSQS